MQLPKVKQQSDYLYERRGPWPQPQPAHPFGFAAGVVHIPKDEIRKWNRTTGLRYAWTVLTYWPTAFIYAMKHPGLEYLSDEQYEEYLTHSSLSKFLSDELLLKHRAEHHLITLLASVHNEKVRHFHKRKQEKYANNIKLKIFDQFLTKSDKYSESDYWLVSDFSLMENMKTLPGLYAAPTMALFHAKNKGEKLKAVAIYFPENKYWEDGVEKLSNEVMLTPDDGEAWELGKYFVMQGASHRISLSAHANLHFPYDSINAISKSSLPKNSVLLRLLLPHFELTLELNYSVLNSKTSPLQNPPNMPYAALVAGPEALGSLFIWGYTGHEHNPSYPEYKFVMYPKHYHTDYGVFLKAYFDVIEAYVHSVIELIPKDEYEDIKIWADYVHGFTPGFPKGNEIFDLSSGELTMASGKDEDVVHGVIRNKGILAQAITSIIWDLSVGHAADHYDYSCININHMPFRLRVPPPQSKNIAPFDRNKIIHWKDIYKHKYEREMFFIPRNWMLLKDVQYAFDPVKEKALFDLSRTFIKELHETEANLTVHNYIPLDNISSSIQY